MSSQTQVYQTFWRDLLTPDILLTDWDTFIHNFSLYLLKNVSVQINHQQIQFLKSLIDPQSRNEVYKSSYLLFIKNFWSTPSNRTKFLKGQMNLSNTKIPRLKFIFTLPNNNLIFTLKYLNDQKCLIKKTFQIKNDKIYNLVSSNQIIEQKQVHYQGFLTFGNLQTNDICVPDCKNINNTHLKLIQIKKKKKIKQNMFSMQSQPKFQQQIEWFLKDVSKSNRLKYCLNNHFKYVVLRSGMMIHFGLTNQYRLQVNDATPNQSSQNQIKQIQQLFDGQRINYLGQIDPEIPQKIIVQMNNKEVTANDIEIMYYKGQLYPQGQTGKIKKPSQLNLQQQIPIKLTLFNEITLQQKKYSFLGSQVTVGRSSNSSIRINQPQIRQIQCQIQCIGGIWLLKNNDSNCKHKVQKSLQQNTLSVSLARKNQLDMLKDSAKIRLSQRVENVIKGKNFCISIKVNIQKRQE